MSVIQARPTLYKGIQMRSRLEADYAAHLDARGCRWKYEPECFADDEGQWLPDFGSSFAGVGGPLATFHEIKPAGPLSEHTPGSIAFVEHVDTVLRRMTIAWQSRPDARLCLTFWQYGGPAFLSLFSLRQGEPWLAYFSGQEVELLWQGMGQYGQCQDRDMALHWRGLVGPMAAHTWPGSVRDGIFTIYADSEEWVAKAECCKNRLIEVLNLLLDDGSVRGISVRLDSVGKAS